VDYFITDISEQTAKQEKDKAREIRKSRWWSNRIAQGICHYCGKSFPPGELTMDHIIPVARGGKSVRNNLVPCCKECNNRKKYLLPMEWDEYMNSVRENAEDE
jgi:5-methylcytosine-specific restriction endonuclease McrA